MWRLLVQRRWFQYKLSDKRMLQFLHSNLPSSKSHWKDVKWLVVDLETTALKPAKGEIASIGWISINNGVITLEDAGHHYLMTKRSVGDSAIYHHIRDMELVDAMPIETVMQHFLKIAAGRVLVFHNAHLDMGFLNKVCRKLFNTPLLAPIADTQQLEMRKLKRQYAQLPQGILRLHRCRQRYGLPAYPAHDALTDALATAELLLAWIACNADDGCLMLGDCLI